MRINDRYINTIQKPVIKGEVKLTDVLLKRYW